ERHWSGLPLCYEMRNCFPDWRAEMNRRALRTRSQQVPLTKGAAIQAVQQSMKPPAIPFGAGKWRYGMSSLPIVEKESSAMGLVASLLPIGSI
ncbi:MAG: hypothetical protein WCH39_17795, partial [Schlesneria sp.]